MVTRWVLYDAVVPESYTFPINPREMEPVHPPRNITGRTTTAVDGAALVGEGNTPPHQWSFSGAILDYAHYAALDDWTSRTGRRIRVTDHFGRRFWVVFLHFRPTPKKRRNRYWSHDYEVQALIVSPIGAPTVGV